MSDIHIFRIEQHIREEFTDKIDLHDVVKLNDQEKDNCFLSRAQAALAIKYLSGTTSENAANSITDGYGDNGIDSIFIDKDNKTLYLLQSKWINSGKSAPKKRDIQSFMIGVDDILSLKFEKFNDRIKRKRSELIDSFKDVAFKIKIVIVYTSNQPLNKETYSEVEDKIEEYNDSTDLFSSIIIQQKDLYKSLLSGVDPRPINLKEITLYNWGKHSEPFEGIYGEMEAEQAAKLWQEYGQNLLVKNLRQFKDVSHVNDLIKQTISHKPNYFWYFNNGITALCRGIGKSAIHGNNRTAGVFNFDDVSIVNGAQTFGSIGSAYINYPEKVKNAKVQIRFIDLVNAPEGFEKEITRYTNTQNRIENKDFASLDPEQARLKHELLLDKKEYVFRTGEKITDKSCGCDIEEATFALACANEDISLSVIAHRNIGTIWIDIEKPPYKSVFNSQTTGRRLWLSVSIYRIVKEELDKIGQEFPENTKTITTIHGDSLILHKVFQVLGRSTLNNDSPKFSINENQVIESTKKVVDSLCKGIDEHFPSIYLNSLFKNTEKVKKLSKYIDIDLSLEKTLFNS